MQSDLPEALRRKWWKYSYHKVQTAQGSGSNTQVLQQ